MFPNGTSGTAVAPTGCFCRLTHTTEKDIDSAAKIRPTGGPPGGGMMWEVATARR
jgi:hypothetical protein